LEPYARGALGTRCAKVRIEIRRQLGRGRNQSRRRR
jgi:hypothetical protein